MTVHDCDQRSDAWRALRCGRVTSTGASKILAKGRGNQPSIQRRDYCLQLVTERLTGQPQENDFQSSWMQRGTEMEADAIAAYEASTGALVEQVGLCAHDELSVGTSPDGFVGLDGMIEVKVPKAATHISYFRPGGPPLEHMAQMRHHLFVTGRQWLDFVSFGPMFPEPLQLFRVTVEAKALDTPAYELVVRQFLREVDEQERDIRSLIHREKAQWTKR